MSRRVMVLLAATAMAVAMLAMAGMASAQQQEEEPEASTATATAEDTTTAEQDSSTAAPLAPSANKDLKIKAINPKPGSTTRDRTPLIKAKVTEKNNNDNNDNNIKKSDIKLYLDGDKKGNFDYKSGKGLIEFTPDNNLSFGKHKVKVVVKAGQGQKDSEKWSFRVEDN
jgi:hypothetical protein